MPMKCLLNLKKTAASKRASLLRRADYAKSFAKDWERLSRSGRYDMTKLKQVMLLLVANDAPLGPEWKDHMLKGDWAGYRECHVGGDFLLIYLLDEDAGPSGSVVFVRAGTHSELFQ
jgi:mRNA interferase YafQ